MQNNPDINLHLTAFAETFVLETRREKWLMLFAQRPAMIASQSSRLFNYLNHNLIEQNDALANVATDTAHGVFYDFHSEPRIMTLAEAKHRKKDNDAIFSITPGKLAIYFFSDGWNFVCTNP